MIQFKSSTKANIDTSQMTLLDNDVFSREEDSPQINNDNIVGGGEDLMNNYKMSNVSRYENLLSEHLDNQTELSPELHKVMVNKMNGSQILSPTAIAKLIE
jgi:hypothetical protein